MKQMKLLISILACLLVSACGYQLQGGGYLNNDVTRIYVRVFENKSSETGAGVVFTNALVEEIIRVTDTKVVNENLADYVIEARVNSITFSVLSRSTTDAVTERKVVSSVDLKILDKNKNAVWSVKNFTTHEEYTVSDDVTVDDANKTEAIDKAAVRNAEQLVSRMLSNF